MKYNFDQIIDRTLNHERKWDYQYIADNYHIQGKELINSSIADLDFAAPQAVQTAIINRANKGVYSYTYVFEEFYEVINKWYKQQHNVSLKNSHIKLVHGTVNALHQLVQCFSQENDNILIQTPVYGPFARAIVNNKRKVITAQLMWNNNIYEIDFNEFENIIKESKPKIFILCNPHNPGGRVWTKLELSKMIEICSKYDVLIISDEVHSDLVLAQESFTSLLSLPVKNNYYIVANSPNKAFNLGGLKSSYLITNNDTLFNKINEQYEKNSITSPNVFTVPAYIAAYGNQDVVEWKNQMLDYVNNNFLYFQNELKNITGLKIMNLQASFLVWINFQNNGISQEEFDKLLIQHKLIVSKESDFAGDTNCCCRINIGTSRLMVENIVKILKDIFNKKNIK